MAVALTALAAAAIALASPAAAPPGFARSEPLTLRAERVTGQDAGVYCARDLRSWRAFMARNGLGRIADEIEGLTWIAVSQAFLHPRVCLRLHGWLAGRRVRLEPLADAIFTFTHEAAHLSGVVNECAADRWAVARLARVARVHFGIRSGERVRAIVRLARAATGYVEAC